jgi:hypothetical protein
MNYPPSGSDGMTLNTMELNPTAIKYLSETRKWTTFFAILGIIGAVFIIITGLVFIIVLPHYNDMENLPYSVGLIGYVYLFVSVLMILPVVYLFRFGTNLNRALKNNDQLMLGVAFQNLALHYRVIGIYTIISIAFYLIAMAVLVVFGAGMAGVFQTL